MRPRHMMIAGALCGVAFSAVWIATGVSNPVLMFGCGMLFGKGYGVWEERTQRSPS